MTAVEELSRVTICAPGQSYVTTYLGKRIDLLAPEIDPECIELEDIAWSLSRSNRWNSMTESPISVAVHSLYTADMVMTNKACLEFAAVEYEELRALMHDAAEAYVTDLPRPLKYLPQMSFYLELEKKVEKAIAIKMGLLTLDKSMRCAVADNIMLANESVMYRPNSPSEWAYEVLERYNITPFSMTRIHYTPEFIFNHFLDRIEELTNN